MSAATPTDLLGINSSKQPDENDVAGFVYKTFELLGVFYTLGRWKSTKRLFIGQPMDSNSSSRML